MQTLVQKETRVQSSIFSTLEGATEIFITGTSRDEVHFEEGLDELYDAYCSLLNEFDLDENTVQFSRIYVSDAANEFQPLQDSRFFRLLQSGAVSVIQQSPLCGSVSFLSYHIKAEEQRLRKSKDSEDPESAFQCVNTQGRFYNLLWAAHSTGSGKDSYQQTENLFSGFSNTLQKYSMSLKNNTIRTWIFVRDVDNNYKGMVDARRKLFSRIGLTNQTRYIASTGIEGKMAETKCLVCADSLSIGNLKEEQIIRMEAPEHLSSTIVYGVTFERGTRIQFGDRSHLYISGTASIDNNGDVLYPGNIRGQTERTLDNIEALLRPQGATLEDMCYIILYIRNRKHFRFIEDILASRIPASIPIIPVEGAVCRPEWLIEMEGVAIVKDCSIYPPFL